MTATEQTAETGEVAPVVEREARAYREARRRLRLLHTELAGRIAGGLR